MKLTVVDIAKLVNGKVQGEGALVITSAAGLSEATSNDISFLKNAKDSGTLKLFESTKAGAVLVSNGFKSNGKTTIAVDNPLAAFAIILGRIAEEKNPKKEGIHKLSSVDPSAKIGKRVSIGPFCIVEHSAEIDDDVCLMGQNYVGARSKIGKGTLLYPQVVLREDVQVGERCIIHAGAILGADGFGFFFANGKQNKIHQVGNVIVEDDVEIGSCTTIDRATTGTTRIKRGVKLDNLVQVAHNVEIGEHTVIAAQVGIAGSAKLGSGVVLGGQVGVGDHVHLKDRTQIGGQSGAAKDTEEGDVLWGTPARDVQDAIKETLLIRRLPELFKDVKKLKENRNQND